MEIEPSGKKKKKKFVFKLFLSVLLLLLGWAMVASLYSYILSNRADAVVRSFNRRMTAKSYNRTAELAHIGPHRFGIVTLSEWSWLGGLHDQKMNRTSVPCTS